MLSNDSHDELVVMTTLLEANDRVVASVDRLDVVELETGESKEISDIDVLNGTDDAGLGSEDVVAELEDTASHPSW